MIDYDTDADLIYAAFMEVYGIDLTEERLHWHKFRALMDGLHGTKLNEVIGYRLYDGSDAGDWKKRMAEFHEMWELPEELTDEFDAKLKQV